MSSRPDGEPRRLRAASGAAGGRRAVAAMRGGRVAVVGDVMLDAFLWGDATRISPEAPVPVVLLERQTWCLGGAANVAANMAALGGRPLLFSVTGADAAAARLQRLAQEAHIEIAALPSLPGRPTTVKHRVFARNKHLLRCDYESTSPISVSVARALARALAMRHDWDAVVISDYAKGVVTSTLVRAVARVCTARGLPWCVDPKRTTIRYNSATVLKPNQRELEALSGLPAGTLPELRRAAARVLRRQGCRYLLVTRGQQGMALFDARGGELLLDGLGRSVADVTGAGDTVTAVVGLGLAARLSLPQIAALANRAGAFVVTRPGIAVVHAWDLLSAE